MMTRVLFLLILWLMQTGLVLLLVNAKWLDAQAQLERSTWAEELGPERHSKLQARARTLYEECFVHSGWIARTEHALLPRHEGSQRGMENLAPWFFRWLESRLAALWQLAFQALVRMELLRLWSGAVLLAVGCATVDGLVRRQVSRIERAYPSADRYLMARRMLLVLLAAPLLYLSLPLAVTSYVVPVWGLALALIVWLMTSHAQHRI